MRYYFIVPLLLCCPCLDAVSTPYTFDSLTTVLSPTADETVERVQEALIRKMSLRSEIPVDKLRSTTLPKQAACLLALYSEDSPFYPLFQEEALAPPASEELMAEGFVLKVVERESTPYILIVGADYRGLLYGVGEALRQMRFDARSVSIAPCSLSQAPAYRFRGSSVSHGGTMQKITGARNWSREEWESYALDLALSGANCFYAHDWDFTFYRSYDLLSETGFRPNQLPGEWPKAWKGTEFGPWPCPSVAEAHEALRAYWRKALSERPATEVLRLYAGDPGGCRCEKCAPWGKTFATLSKEIATIWLEMHPESTVLLSNQDVTNQGDQEIFDFLHQEPNDWCAGIAYGPGCNALSDYFRRELRDDLFHYPAFGPVNRYLAYTLNALPPGMCIVHYSDITHWISSQYQVENPDRYVRAIYGRRTYHARPKAMYAISQAIMPFSEGDIVYSEGYHDEFHQYLWNRLLWNPHRSLDEVVLEYCRYYFGADAAPLMREALYQLEENLEAPLVENPGVLRYYELVKEAGTKIPDHLMKNDHRWRLAMQKAALDYYFQLKIQTVERRVKHIQDESANALTDAQPVPRVKALLEEAQAPLENPQMITLKEEARRLGEESNARFGVRNVGFFSTEQPFRSLATLERRLIKALKADDNAAMIEQLKRVVSYEESPSLLPLMKR